MRKIAVNTCLNFKITIKNNIIPITVGGDHSLAIGSIAGSAKNYDDLGVIWLDTDPDINTDKTTTTFHIHGYPLAASMGFGQDELTKLYFDKTTLKNVEGKEAEYQVSKGMINSCYGMCVTDPCRDINEYLSLQDEWYEEKLENYQIEDYLKKYNDSFSRFLYYPWGVWITAYARRMSNSPCFIMPRNIMRSGGTLMKE